VRVYFLLSDYRLFFLFFLRQGLTILPKLASNFCLKWSSCLSLQAHATSLSFLYMSLFPYHSFDYCSLVVCFEVRECESTVFFPSRLFSLFRISWVSIWILGFFCRIRRKFVNSRWSATTLLLNRSLHRKRSYHGALELQLRAYILSHSTNPFLWRVFFSR
jgi:hypothetical protein